MTVRFKTISEKIKVGECLETKWGKDLIELTVTRVVCVPASYHCAAEVEAEITEIRMDYYS